MTEGFRSKENGGDISKEEVSLLLRKHPEDLSPLHVFLDRREKEVRNSKDTLHLNVEIAEIYRDAGLTDVARQAFLDAANQAWQEREGSLYQVLVAKFEKLQG
ncbi:MAG: hypothetical protein WAV50_01435 [Minisyncoccia bacterium]